MPPRHRRNYLAVPDQRPCQCVDPGEIRLVPGLAVDRFGDVFVCQVNSAGMERLTPALIDALVDLYAPRAVVLRGDSPVREFEGLKSRVEVIAGEVEGSVEIAEYGVRFLADPLAGQKTGWFFDQRDNRAFLASLADGVRMLDGYCYSGAFAVAGAVALEGAARPPPHADGHQHVHVVPGVAEVCAREQHVPQLRDDALLALPLQVPLSLDSVQLCLELSDLLLQLR